MAQGKDFDAGDPAQVKEKAQKAVTRDKRIANGLKLVLSNADSRLWLYAALESAGPFQDAFATNSSLTSYRCGQQAWAKSLVAIMLDDHLEDYTKMMRECKPD